MVLLHAHKAHGGGGAAAAAASGDGGYKCNKEFSNSYASRNYPHQGFLEFDSIFCCGCCCCLLYRVCSKFNTQQLEALKNATDGVQ